MHEEAIGEPTTVPLLAFPLAIIAGAEQLSRHLKRSSITKHMQGKQMPLTTSNNPISLARQGSFYVGGRQVTAAGTFESTSAMPSSAGQTYWVDQMYVQYQIPVNPRKLPIVLVHGGGCTGRVWETTPDGREGYATILLRQGFSVFIVDLPRGGRSGFPSFTGELGKLDDEQRLVEQRTFAPGREHAWTRWRLGPRYPGTFHNQAFPMSAVDSFLKGMRPSVTDDPKVMSDALISLLEEIGPATLVTHSNSGLYGWLAGANSNLVRGIVSYEPAFVYPESWKASIRTEERPRSKAGKQPAVTSISDDSFARLVDVPMEIVFGDNIPLNPDPNPLADGRRIQLYVAEEFTQLVNEQGGRASLLSLPEAGLRGNSHFMFSDINSIDVAALLCNFLSRHRLDE
ncbi:alpha/beta fold hydrolase [Paraburkholderia sp. JHI869]|uniref:alpha/beta hydrolase n=1 Tax=Paraburkholderia sp. JHI869 TaxID=3112959 RepID=UPI0031757FE4